MIQTIVFPFFYQITLKPDALSDIEAGGVLYSALTAWSSFHSAGLFGKMHLHTC